ncbi:MAG: DUF1559 domain-containing protein, partial [Planctomycetota bacterium]
RNAYRSSYVFCTGYLTDYNAPYELYGYHVGQGVFGNNGSAKIAGILDGTSNTLAMGEALGNEYHMWNVWQWGPWALSGSHVCCHGRVVISSSSPPIRFTAAMARDWNINSPYQNDSLGRVYAWVFSSTHPGGAQFVLADGSARFLSETIDYRTFCRLNFAHDGEPVGQF